MNQLLAAAMDMSTRSNSMPLINYVIIGGCVIGGIIAIITLVATIRYFRKNK